jgi:dehydrogenase/reductase SDR family protein 7B
MVKAGGGWIVAISSVSGIVGVPLRSAYSAAKHGLIGYHDSVRAENEHLGIHVHVVAPGSVRTNVSRNALVADGSTRGVSDAAIDNGISPAEAAKATLAAIEAGKRELVLATGMGHEIVVLRRHDPEALFDRMSALVRAGYAQKMAADSGER